MRTWRFTLVTLATLVTLLTPLAGCGGDDGRRELWIYTSIYPSVIERMKPTLERAFPDVRFRWYQKGSEQVAARLTMELEAGKSPCDLLLTSDPFYYAELAAAGLLLPYESPAAKDVPAGLRDPGHAYVTVRVPVMVLGVNTKELPPEAWPTAFADLGRAPLRGLIAMGDPLKSGTNFTTVAALTTSRGWDLIEAWSRNGIVAEGGNSAVLRRLETGDRPVGVILLENLLPRIEKGSPLKIVYPEEGAIPVPSPIAILKGTTDEALAKRVYDVMFSDAIQEAIVAGHMYSPLPDRDAPAGARPWSELRLHPWDAAFVDDVKTRRKAIKQRFREIMRR